VGLTSLALSLLLVGLSLGLLVAIIVGWRRLAGSGLRPVALRTVSLIALQACVLSLIFVLVNRSGEFYSSWSDLLGADTGQGSVVASASVSSALVRPVVITSRLPVRVPGSRVSGGSLDTVRFAGQLSGLTVTGHVFLPAGYGLARSATRYPVIVAISGGPGGTSSPYSAKRLADNAAALIAAGKLRPVIIAMLPAALSAADQGCLNVPAEPATASSAARPAVPAATFFAQDLPGMLKTAFRAGSAAGSWALLGDSTGGYCALQLALDDSWVFSVAVAPGGDYTRPPGSNENAGSPQLSQQEDLLYVLRSQPMQSVSVLLTGSGAADGQAASFVSQVHRPMRVSIAALDAGSWPLAGVLTWIGTALRPGTAGASDRPAGGRAQLPSGRANRPGVTG
jgi:enterochelin esterase-like enzyme